VICVEIPMRLPSRANLEHMNWAKRKKLVDGQARPVALTLSQCEPPLSASVRLTRVAARLIRDEHDNLPGAFKAVVDAVAKWLGVDDGDKDRVRWFYAQEKRSKTNLVRIEVVPWHEDCGHCGQWVWPETEAA